MVELGLYESTTKAYADLADRGVEPHSEEWNHEIEGVLARQRAAMAPRLWPEIEKALRIGARSSTTCSRPFCFKQ